MIQKKRRHYFLLVIITLTKASANTIIAKKHGDFKKFSICQLSEGKGTLEIDHFKNGKIIETTKRYNTFSDLKSLAPHAISSIESE